MSRSLETKTSNNENYSRSTSLGERIRNKKNRALSTVATLVALVPAAAALGVTTGCAADGDYPTSILGYPIPTQFAAPLEEAGQICPGYSTADAAAQALAESSIGQNDGPVRGSDGNLYMGPAMLNPKSALFQEYSEGIAINSPSAVVIMGRIVCIYLPQFGGSLVDALDAYNAGPNNIAGAGNYGSKIISNASTVKFGTSAPQEQSSAQQQEQLSASDAWLPGGYGTINAFTSTSNKVVIEGTDFIKIGYRKWKGDGEYIFVDAKGDGNFDNAAGQEVKVEGFGTNSASIDITGN